MLESRVGIVIPTFNRVIVTEAAHSAEAALGGKDNIVIVDDGSTDKDALRTLDELQAEGFRILRQDNAGVAAARNAGLALLTTPYAFCLDSDDRIGDVATEAADIADANPDVCIVTGSGIEFDETGWMSEPIPPGNPTRESMWLRPTLANPSLFRVADWKKVGGYPVGLVIGEDVAFWLRLLRDGGRVHVCDSTFLYCRFHSGRTQHHIDPRARAAASNLILDENRDLAAEHIDGLVEQLKSARSLLAEYRHAYRHADRAKAFVRRLLKRQG